MRSTVRIGQIEGWLYQSPAPHAVIVMAPGLCGTKEGPLEAFAEGFADAGFTVLAIDFRGSGGSGGKPRYLVDPLAQIEDYLSAINFACTLSLPIVLWGTSFSASAAICSAARTTGIAAVIVQVPWLGDPPSRKPSRLQMAWYIALSLLDMVWPRPIYIRAYGVPGETAFAISEQNGDHPFWKLVPPFENKMAVRGLKNLDAVSARDTLPTLACPVLLIAAMQDDMIAFEGLRTARLPGSGSIFLQYDCGHFDPYVSSLFAPNLRAQIEFLDAMVSHDSDLADRTPDPARMAS